MTGDTPREAEATNQELRQGLAELRTKLDIIESEMSVGPTAPDVIQGVEQSVSSVRTTLWALMRAQHEDDYPTYLGKIRVRRATETCEDVLADLHAETLDPAMPGLEVFRATLRELADICRRRGPDQAPPPEGHDA